MPMQILLKDDFSVLDQITVQDDDASDHRLREAANYLMSTYGLDAGSQLVVTESQN